MNVEELAKRAIAKIRKNWGIPQSGLLAGGSIANLIWEEVSGNKATVNDIDVFLLDDIADDPSKDSLFNYQEKEAFHMEGYRGIIDRIRNKGFYSIIESKNDGIFNYVRYKSSTKDPSIVIDSFDINCVKIGYYIDEDRFIWTKEFEDFLNTGQLKICNLITPPQTAIRLAKKSKELNAKLDSFEFKLIQYSTNVQLNDRVKFRFKDRYYEMFFLNEEILSPFFEIDRDRDAEDYVRINFLEDVRLFFLRSKYENLKINWHGFSNSRQFIFYMRNIFGNEKMEKIWEKLHWFFESDGYLDEDVSQEDIELLYRLAYYAPNSIENLKGMKISEQIAIVKKLLFTYEKDPIIAISILESKRIDKSMEIDEDMKLILELSVRKKIIEKKEKKIANILGIEKPKGFNDIKNNDDLPF